MEKNDSDLVRSDMLSWGCYEKIRLIVFDIDGVITDGKKYIDGCGAELKALQLRDLDAIGTLKRKGYILGCISGENTPFSRQIAKTDQLDFALLGCKEKGVALGIQIQHYGLLYDNVCYIGDGKYDVPALEKAGLSVCPADAIEEVKQVSDIVLKRKGGEGCLAELDMLLEGKRKKSADIWEPGQQEDMILAERIAEHKKLTDNILQDRELLVNIRKSVQMITSTYGNGGNLFLCGNGGSAADAQHLAGELVGRFYLERLALSAEALTTNTSVITALANDYDYNRIFSRQLEARARKGDILIGLTTSGTSGNIVEAFQKAKEIDVRTILFTGEIAEETEILRLTDCLLKVPSRNTPRVQEMHILMGHIICELVEQDMTKKKG